MKGTPKMNLTDTTIKNAKPKAKPYKLHDVDGLFLLINPTGSKLWRFKFRFDGKEQSLSFGSYPAISLKRAREKRDEAKTLISEGINPSDHRKAMKMTGELARANTLEVMAREWLIHKAKQKDNSGGFAERYVKDLSNRLSKNLFPYLGSRPITAITSPEILKMLRKIEARGARETAHRTLQTLGQIYRYAIATGRAVNDPTAPLKRDALEPVEKGHRAAIVKPEEVVGLLKDIEGYQGSEIVRCALKLSPLFFLRPGELRKAEWSEIDFENKQWILPAIRMKIKTQDHIVPLSTQAFGILKDLHTLTGHRQFLFPSPRDWKKPMSDNTVNAALRRMGYTSDQMCAHGFRAMARTIMDEVLNIRPDLIEHQLAHAVKGPLGRAYNRTAHLPERRKMMQQWADYLDEIKLNGVKPGAMVIQIGERVA